EGGVRGGQHALGPRVAPTAIGNAAPLSGRRRPRASTFPSTATRCSFLGAVRDTWLAPPQRDTQRSHAGGRRHQEIGRNKGQIRCRKGLANPFRARPTPPRECRCGPYGGHRHDGKLTFDDVFEVAWQFDVSVEAVVRQIGFVYRKLADWANTVLDRLRCPIG